MTNKVRKNNTPPEQHTHAHPHMSHSRLYIRACKETQTTYEYTKAIGYDIRDAIVTYIRNFLVLFMIKKYV